jgi:hypothetical protein
MHGAASDSDEATDEAGRESFPASDPPSQWSGADAPDKDGAERPEAE